MILEACDFKSCEVHVEVIYMKVGIYSLGCKVNLYESEFVESKLKEKRYTIVPFDEVADVYIINTCSVTNESDRKSRKTINEAKRRNKDAIIVVMGCYSQLFGSDTDADIVIGNKDKSRIIELIEEYMKTNKKINNVESLIKDTPFENMEITHFDNHTRAFVKIQDGCDAFCSYCIIPYTRGTIRSKDPSLVIEEITSLVNNGYKEIVLTGIHTGKYGKDLGISLSSLIEKIIAIPNLYRLRLSSIEINEVTDDLLNLMEKSPIIARHFHIPLQAGSDKILKLMERKYDKEYFLNKVKQIRLVDPDISLTTDLIVGFPGETDEDFEETYNFLKEVKFTKIHTFPYSMRDHTKAALMPNQISADIKKKRVHQILELSDELEKEYYNKYLNKEVSVLTEEVNGEYTTSHTSNYLKIYIKGNYPANEVYPVLITEIKNNKIFGIVQK